MKDRVRRVEYYAINLEDRPGEGASLTRMLAREKVNLLGALAFPVSPGKTQLDLVPEEPDLFRRAAARLGLELGAPKHAFLVQGTDRPGAMEGVLDHLAEARVNVRATMGVVCGGKRYGAVIWVAPADVEEASIALGASVLAIQPV